MTTKKKDTPTPAREMERDSSYIRRDSDADTPTPAREMEPLNGGGGAFHSWASAKVGDVLEGTYGGMEPGKYGNNYLIVVDGQPVKFAASAGLADLSRVRIGAFVRIQHDGLQKGKNGREYRAFNIQVEKGGKLDLQATVAA